MLWSCGLEWDADGVYRYNTFFILYPMGAGSEFLCIIAALQEAWSWDQRYYWFLCAILVTYPPGECSQNIDLGAQLMMGRSFCPVYTHDGAEEKADSREEEGELRCSCDKGWR